MGLRYRCLQISIIILYIYLLPVPMSASQPCEDFLEFQESIKKLRAVDDNIIYTLNTSLPTESFKGQVNCEKVCTNLFNQLKEVHKKREKKINDCILISAESLKHLRELRDNSPDDVEIDKKFKSEQRKLRLLQSEVNVEDIVNERSLKAFKERCRAYLHSRAS